MEMYFSSQTLSCFSTSIIKEGSKSSKNSHVAVHYFLDKVKGMHNMQFMFDSS